MMASLQGDHHARGDDSTQHSQLNSFDNITVTYQPDLDIYIAKRDYSADQPGQLSIHKGEKILILHKSKNEFKAINTSAKIGYVPRAYIIKDYSLENYSWYHGEIQRQEAERLFDSSSDGSFLIRDSKTSFRDYSLSLYSDNRVYHYRVHRLEDGTGYCIIKGVYIETVPQLIVYYHGNSDGLAIELIYPIPNRCKSFYSIFYP